jgi:hypothetical protein
MAINTQYMQKGQNLVLNLGNTHTTKEALNLSSLFDKETLPDARAGNPETYLDGKDKFENCSGRLISSFLKPPTEWQNQDMYKE